MIRPGSRPTVSVIVPAFNAEVTIDAALRSVFDQTFSDFEVIVVDDGSTDATRDRLARWKDQVTVIRQANAGPAAARNRAIRESRGQLLAFLDADDRWLPWKLELQVPYFDLYPQTGLLHTAAVREAPGAQAKYVRGEPAGPAPAPPRGVFCDLFHTNLDINTLTVMIRRAVLDEVGLFDERREIYVEDWDLWLRIAARHPVGYLPTVTAVRRPGGIMSADFEKTLEGQAAVVDKMSEVCGRACPLHAAMPAACLRRRWHRLHWELAYARRRAGDRAGARRALLAALARRPAHLPTYLQLAATLLGGRLKRFAARARTTARRTGTASSPGAAASLRGAVTNDPGGGGRSHAWWRQARSHRATTIDSRVPSLVRDTYYRRARRAAAERVHDLDDFLSRRGDSRRVLFEAASPMSFVIFQPVYERLRTDQRLEFFFTATGSWDASQLYEHVGIHENVVPASRAAWMKVDACINTDFWDATWLHRRTRRLHLFHGVAGKYGLDAPVELAPSVAAYDRLLFPNRDRLDRYVEAGLVQAGSPKGALVGYPKVDRLVNGSIDTARVAADLALDRAALTVIYAPTWSPYSSLAAVGEELVRQIAAAGFNVIVKLHDRSYDPKERGSGGIDWASRFSASCRHPRVRFVRDPDVTPYLAVADALVTDHSSVGFEFALLDRPIVIVDSPDLIARAHVTPSKVAALRAAAEVVSSAAGAVAALERQFDDRDLHRDGRRLIASRFFHCPGTATQRAAAVVYEVLALDAPAPTLAGRGAAPPVSPPLRGAA